MSKVKWMAGSCFALVLALFAWGCAGSAGPAASFNTVTGQHPADWLQVHYIGYVQTPGQCRSCHGSTSDPSQAGGVSKVSCFSCHTNGVDHPAGDGTWSLIDSDIVWAPAIHGAFVLSTRGGDFDLHIGQDVSIGYASHTGTTVSLYLQASFTFLLLTSEAAVVLSPTNVARPA